MSAQKKSKKPRKVLVAMSGGVDSSVAAYLLQAQGYQVTGVFLRFWKDPNDPEKRENSCCSLESFVDAKRVASKLGIPIFSLDFSRPFKKAVVDYFLSEYKIGRTPNPCVVCNKQIKLGLLLKKARALGYDYLASGHYAKLLNYQGESALYRGIDPQKDQSYFLYTFEQSELTHLLFPVGKYRKDQVRKIAKQANLEIAQKKDSQDICFLAGPHNNFLRRHLILKTGPIKLQESGAVLGEHQGLPLYTIGQRRGIEIGGTGPYYVAQLDYKTNTLWVVKNWNEEILYQDSLIASQVNWQSNRIKKFPLKCQAVIRYGHPAVPVAVSLKNKHQYLVKFNTQQRAITPGQSVVFYQGNRVLGGGIIN